MDKYDPTFPYKQNKPWDQMTQDERDAYEDHLAKAMDFGVSTKTKNKPKKVKKQTGLK